MSESHQILESVRLSVFLKIGRCVPGIVLHDLRVELTDGCRLVILHWGRKTYSMQVWSVVRLRVNGFLERSPPEEIRKVKVASREEAVAWFSENLSRRFLQGNLSRHCGTHSPI